MLSNPKQVGMTILALSVLNGESIANKVGYHNQAYYYPANCFVFVCSIKDFTLS